MLLLPCVDVQSLLSPVRDATSVLSCPTMVLVTLAIVFACLQLVKNCPGTDDPRGARAVWKLGVVGPELDDGSTGKSLTTGATSLASALRAPSAVV